MYTIELERPYETGNVYVEREVFRDAIWFFNNFQLQEGEALVVYGSDGKVLRSRENYGE